MKRAPFWQIVFRLFSDGFHSEQSTSQPAVIQLSEEFLPLHHHQLNRWPCLPVACRIIIVGFPPGHLVAGAHFYSANTSRILNLCLFILLSCFLQLGFTRFFGPKVFYPSSIRGIIIIVVLFVSGDPSRVTGPHYRACSKTFSVRGPRHSSGNILIHSGWITEWWREDAGDLLSEMIVRAHQKRLISEYGRKQRTVAL